MKTVRRRVIARARYLQALGRFQKAIHVSVSEWNDTYPEYATKQRAIGEPAEDEPAPDEPVFRVPEPLALALADSHNLRATEAQSEWQERIERLADDWWPPKYYPRWIGSVAHPAAGFVRACHMYDPRQLEPSQWVPEWPPRPFFADHDLTDPSSRSEREQRLFDRHWGLIERLLDTVHAGVPITEKLIMDLDGESDLEARKASLQRPKQEFAYLPILADLSSDDYRDLQTEVLGIADAHLRECAAALKTNGQTPYSIARLFGLDPKTVANWFRRS